MSQLIIQDAGYAAIMADPELAIARRKLSLHEIRLIVRHARADPPRHVYWGAGEPDCPSDIKAGNGELHTLRCKVCGEDDPHDQRCFNIASDLPSGRAALVEECARVAEEYPSTEYADIPVIRGIAHAIRNLSEKSK